MEQIDRNQLKNWIDAWLIAWAKKDVNLFSTYWTEDAIFNSSAHGNAIGASNIVQLIIDRQPQYPVSLYSSNLYYAAINKDNYSLSFYIYGIVQNEENSVMTFGVTGLSEIIVVDNHIRMKSLDFSLNWTEGEDDLIPKWKKPLGYRFWKVGDSINTIVSEVDAPWNKYTEFNSPNSVEELLQTYAKYAFAIDQADFHLLKEVFADDIEGDFTPMGYLKGSHQVIGTMKAFR